MKVAKMLSPETDTDALAKRAFMHLEGITDDWIKTLEVEKVAGGQVSPDEDIRLDRGVDPERYRKIHAAEDKCSISQTRRLRIWPTLTRHVFRRR